jgi:hypothetical protein
MGRHRCGCNRDFDNDSDNYDNYNGRGCGCDRNYLRNYCARASNYGYNGGYPVGCGYRNVYAFRGHCGSRVRPPPPFFPPGPFGIPPGPIGPVGPAVGPIYNEDDFDDGYYLVAKGASYARDEVSPRYSD